MSDDEMHRSSDDDASSSEDTDVSDESPKRPSKPSAAPSKKKKKKKKSKKSQPGRYSQLVIDAICKLGERNGSSLAKIFNEAKKVPWFDQGNGRTYLRYSIKALVQNDTLLQVKGTGANGSFKLNRKKLEGKLAKEPAAPQSAPPTAQKKSHKKKPQPSGDEPKKSHKKKLPSAEEPKKSHKKKPSSGEEKSAKPGVLKVHKSRTA